MNSSKLHEAISMALEGSKAGDKPRKSVEAPDSLISIAHARIVDLVSEGEIEGFPSGDNFLRDIYLDETPIENADGTRNFKSLHVEARMGTQDQEYIPGFSAVENELQIGLELKQSQPWTRSFTNLQLSAVRIRLGVQSLSKTNQENGDIKGYKVEYAIDVGTDGGPLTEVMRSALNGKCSGLYERSHRVELPKATTSGWIVRVRRLTVDDTSAYVQDTTAISSVTEIIDGKFRYPMSAVVGIQIDASQFQSIPTRAYRLRGRRVKVPTNYDPVTRTYTGVWDGTFKVAWTNNPAWVFHDMATHKRYGLGRLVSELQIDKYSLYSIAQYCDEIVPDGFGGTEPRMTCNLYLQRASDAWKVMGDLASIFRGICYWANGSIVPTADRPSDPVYTYTNANVVDGLFTYQSSGRKARHTAVIVSYHDMSDFGRLKSDYYDDPDMIARFGFQLTEIVAMGSTSRGQAQRVAKWLLLSEKLLTNTCSWQVGLDGTFALPGQIVRVADKWRAGRRMGGRISAAALNSVTLDVAPDPAPAPGDTITILLPTGVTETRTISTVAGRVVTPTVNFSAIPAKQSAWAIESNDLKNQLFRVLSVAKGDKGTYAMTGLQHNPDLFDAVDLGEPISVPPTSLVAAPNQARPASVTITAAERAGAVIAMPLLTASWPAAPGAVRYQIQWRKDSGEWTTIQDVHGTTADYQTPFPGDYEAKVQAINALGVVSVPQMSAVFTLADQSMTPGFVDTLNADINEALTSAQNAQATADGVVDFFWQDAMPVIGTGAGQAKDGDFWVDTNDGNHLWRVTGGIWVDAQDDAIGQALIAAQTAQGTADSKVRTFFAPTAPTATSVGDLWFNTTVGVKKLFRWNGSNWSDEIADVTLDQLGGSGVNVLPDQYSMYEQTALPTTVDFGGVTKSRVTAGTHYGIGALRIDVTDGAAERYVFLGATSDAAGLNIPITQGKKYLVSATVRGVGTSLYITGHNASTYATFTGYDDAMPATHRRMYWVLDTSAFAAGTSKMQLRISINGATGSWAEVEGVMVEELIGRKIVPSAYTRGTSVGQALDALFKAQSAQATADGAIDIYRQSAAPTGMKIGDYWQDSDDGRWWYTANGTTWTESTDSRLPQLVTDLQTTNGVVSTKTRLFYQEAQPTATANGDMWFQPSSSLTRYWNGSGWSLQADNSLLTQQATTLVKDGGFEGGGIGWWVGSPFAIEQSVNVAFIGTKGLVRGPGAGEQDAYCDTFAVAAGDRIVTDAMIRNLAFGADGTAYLIILFYALDGTYLGEDKAVNSVLGTPVGSSGWVRVVNIAVAPANAAKARVGIRVVGHTTGYWCMDQVRAVRHEQAESGAVNLLPNSDFGGMNGTLAPWTLGWNPCNQPDNWHNRRSGLWAGDGWAVAGTGQAASYFGTGPTGLTPAVQDLGMGTVYIPISNAKRYQFHALLAAHRCKIRVMVAWFDANKNYISEIASFETANEAGGQYEDGWERLGGFATPPANAHFAQVFFRRTDTNVGQTNSYAWIMKAFFGEASANQVDFSPWSKGPDLNADSISTGTHVGMASVQDLFEPGWSNRIGLNVKGSRKILGGARNSRASLVAGVTSVRTATALSADSTGAVSVNAHSVEISGETVTYNAVSNAVVGLSQGVTYTIYTFDLYLDGGTRTYYAQTSVLSMQQAGEGAVHIGNVTIPTSGSSSGGGGGTGDPNDWCVDAEMFLPDGRVAKDIDRWHGIPCWNEKVDDPGIVHLPVESNTIVEQQPCHMIVTNSGASVIASDSTPMTLRDGRTVRLPEMHGEDALVRHEDGTIQWEPVVSCLPMGLRTVAKIKVHQKCYFAGTRPGATIATHNPTQKP